MNETLISPRVYRPSTTSRMVVFIVGCFLLVPSLMLLRITGGRELDVYVMAAVPCIPALLVFYIGLNAAVRFDGTSLVISNGLTKKALIISDLRGYRNLQMHNSTVYELSFKDDKRKPVLLSVQYRYDDAFMTMLKALPCLDAVDEQVAHDIVESDVRYGTTDAEKSATLKRLKTVTCLSIFLPVGLIFWGFYPHPLWLYVSIILALPWVAILLQKTSRGLYGFDGMSSKNLVSSKTQGDLTALFIASAFVPIFGLQLPGSGYPLISPDHWSSLVTPSIGIGIVMAILMAYCFKQAKGWRLFFLFVCLTSYGSGVISMLNSLLDQNAANTYSLEIKSKHNTTGKNSAYWLDFTNNSSISYPGSITQRVDPGFYSHVKPNQTICGIIHPGAFGMAWTDVAETCEPTGK